MDVDVPHTPDWSVISVVSCINPCFYYAKCGNCLTVLDVHTIVNNLELEEVDEDSLLLIGERVVVKHFDGMWRRAVVMNPAAISVDMDIVLCEVLCPDDLSRIKVNYSSIRKVEDSNQLSYMALPHIIALYEGVPNVSCPSMLRTIKGILKATEAFSFIPKKSIAFGGIPCTFGHLICESSTEEGRKGNLLNHLINVELAFYRPESYLKMLYEDNIGHRVVESNRSLTRFLKSQHPKEPLRRALVTGYRWPKYLIPKSSKPVLPSLPVIQSDEEKRYFSLQQQVQKESGSSVPRDQGPAAQNSLSVSEQGAASSSKARGDSVVDDDSWGDSTDEDF